MSSNVLDEGIQLLREGRHEEAISAFEKVANVTADSGESAHVLAQLADAFRAGGRLADAIRTAQQALEAAKRAADEGAEAHACLSLGTALLVEFDRSESRANFSQAVDCLDRSASIYKGMGLIDFSTALFTLGEAMLRASHLETAAGLYSNVIHELTDARWAESELTAKHADYLRGRAFAGLGLVALRSEDRPQAERHFEAAINLLLAGDLHTAGPVLDELANIFERELGDREVASHIRDAATRRFPGH